LADLEQVICASPSYLAAHGTPMLPEDLHQHTCLAYTLAESPTLWMLDGPGGSISVAVQARVAVNNSLMLRDLLVAGGWHRHIAILSRQTLYGMRRSGSAFTACSP
jgi:DNA-binding transcriptional LysR family regulator